MSANYLQRRLTDWLHRARPITWLSIVFVAACIVVFTVRRIILESRSREVQRALLALPPDAYRAVQDSRIPVLLPADEKLLRALKVTIGSNFYAIAASAEGASFSVAGSPALQESAAAANARPRVINNRRQVTLMENEGIQIATWLENGSAYVADLECQSDTDARCRDERFLLSLVRSLIDVSGGRR